MPTAASSRNVRHAPLEEGAQRTVLSVPTAAVQELDGTSVVFVTDRGGTFRRRDVVLGRVVDDAVRSSAGYSRRADRRCGKLRAQVGVAEGVRAED